MKISLERRCNELTETVRQLSADRDQADQQYQQYVAQLNGQLQAASSKVNTSCDLSTLLTQLPPIIHYPLDIISVGVGEPR